MMDLVWGVSNPRMKQKKIIPILQGWLIMKLFIMKNILPNIFLFSGQSHSHSARSIFKQFPGQNWGHASVSFTTMMIKEAVSWIMFLFLLILFPSFPLKENTTFLKRYRLQVLSKYSSFDNIFFSRLQNQLQSRNLWDGKNF